MKMEEIFSKERDRYIRFLAQTLDKIAGREAATVGELLISINNEAIPYPYRYL